MGKYQLDNKGKQQVERYHEKQALSARSTHKERVKALLRQHQEKK